MGRWTGRAGNRGRRDQRRRPQAERIEIVRRFVDDEAGYLAWLAGHPSGFILNLLRSEGAGALMLHRTTCPTISGGR
jgi:hypothetical protein